MFDIVYIILAFDNPNQINRLISSLNSEFVFFYIHVDKKINQAPFEFALISEAGLNSIDFASLVLKMSENGFE